MVPHTAGISAEMRYFLKHKTENGDKEETWTRLTEMGIFSLRGFGVLRTRSGVGTYNRERVSTIFRQYDTEKDSLWVALVYGPQ